MFVTFAFWQSNLAYVFSPPFFESYYGISFMCMYSTPPITTFSLTKCKHVLFCSLSLHKRTFRMNCIQITDTVTWISMESKAKCQVRHQVVSQWIPLRNECRVHVAQWSIMLTFDKFQAMKKVMTQFVYHFNEWMHGAFSIFQFQV